MIALAAGCGTTSGSGPRGALRGVVKDVGGGPAAHVDVALVPAGQPDGAFQIAVTDTGGRYAFSGLAAGSYVLSSRSDNNAAAADTVGIPDGDATPDTLRLVPGGTFYGRVMTGLGSAPVSNARIVPVGLLALAVSDSAGAWALPGIPPGRWMLEVSHAGYATAAPTSTIPAPGDSVFLQVNLNALVYTARP